MNVSLRTLKRTVAPTEMLLILPAALFISALVVRNLQPQHYEPAHTAQRIVTWHSARPWTLSLLLIALPLAALATGWATLWRSWNADADLRQATRQPLAAIRTHLATLFVAAAMVTAGGILAVVAAHVLTD